MTSCGRVGRLGAGDDRQADEVVVARIAPGLQISSRFSKSVVLMARSSAIASTTRSTSARSSSEVVPVTRASTSALASSVARPRWICLSKFLVIAATTPSTLSWPRPTYSTSYPPLAKTSTMPLAIVPVPTTPTCVMSWRSCGLRVGRRRLLVGDDDRAVGRLVGVEAAAGLAAEHAGGDHLLEDRRRRVQAVAALAVHRLEDLVRRVEADQVEQRQRAHRVAAAEAHRGVDVLAGGVAALVHRDRVVEVAEQQGVGDEAGLVAADDRVLADRLDQRLHVGERPAPR